MEIIGICGKKRHGKDTLGGFLQERFRFTPIAFADPIKRIAMDLYGLSYDQCFGSVAYKETADCRWGLSPRHIMQQIGTEVARNIHPDTWTRYLMSTIKAANQGEEPLIHVASKRGFYPARAADMSISRWVICDIRFPNEAALIRGKGGRIFKVVRPSLEGGSEQDTHSSETQVDQIAADQLFLNSGTLQDLRDKLHQTMKNS